MSLCYMCVYMYVCACVSFTGSGTSEDIVRWSVEVCVVCSANVEIFSNTAEQSSCQGSIF